MTTQETVSQNTNPDDGEPLQYLQLRVPESAHRHFRAQAAANGRSNSEYFVDLLTEHTGYKPPTDPAPTSTEQEPKS